MNISNHTTSRRQFLKTTLKTTAAASGLACLSSCNALVRQADTPPNIVLIISDDQGYHDAGSYGSEIPTPNIDRIGKNGIRFTNFYVTAPVCTPSRYSLLTGRYPQRVNERFHGPLGPGKDDQIHLPDDEVTLADILKQRGYATALIGKWHLGHGDPAAFGPNAHGFDYFYGYLPGCIDYYLHSYRTEPNWFRNTTPIKEPGYSDDLFTKEALHFIGKNKNQPFFLDLAYETPHYGKCPEGNLLQTPPGHPDLPEKSKKDRNVYAAMIRHLDDNIGRVLDHLEKNNLTENTIVLFISDNGGDIDYGGSNLPLNGEKGTLLEGGIKIPCMIQWPKEIKPGQIIDYPLISLDWLPTLTHLTGSKLPHRPLDGLNITETLLRNSPPLQREMLFIDRSRHAIRQGPWKYISERKHKEYLFNLADDPNEAINLINTYPQLASRLKAEYEKRVREMSREIP